LKAKLPERVHPPRQIENPKPSKKEVLMTTTYTLPRYAATLMDGAPSERMSRREFNSYLYDLFECEDKNTATADEVHECDDFYVEVFNNSPDGPMLAVHDASQVVEIYRWTADPTASVA
jgi:hypothetical protein